MKTQINWYISGESYGNYVVVSKGTKTVARIPWGENDLENAKLIASAPELLEQLENAKNIITAMLDQSIANEGVKRAIRQKRDMIRKTIKKATE